MQAGAYFIYHIILVVAKKKVLAPSRRKGLSCVVWFLHVPGVEFHVLVV
jgi:hypothetical protein